MCRSQCSMNNDAVVIVFVSMSFDVCVCVFSDICLMLSLLLLLLPSLLDIFIVIFNAAAASLLSVFSDEILLNHLVPPPLHCNAKCADALDAYIKYHATPHIIVLNSIDRSSSYFPFCFVRSFSLASILLTSCTRNLYLSSSNGMGTENNNNKELKY